MNLLFGLIYFLLIFGGLTYYWEIFSVYAFRKAWEECGLDPAEL